MKRRFETLFRDTPGGLPKTITLKVLLLALLCCLISALQFALFYDRILEELASLLTFQLLPQELAAINARLPDTLSALLAWGIPLVLINCVLAALAGFWLSRRIAGPVIAIRNHLEKVGNGNLNDPLVLRQGDEMQEVADTLNQAVSKLQVMVWGIKTNLETLEALQRQHPSLQQQQQLDSIKMNLEWFDTLEQQDETAATHS